MQTKTILKSEYLGHYAAEAPKDIFSYRTVPSPIEIPVPFSGGVTQFMTYKRGHITMHFAKVKRKGETGYLNIQQRTFQKIEEVPVFWDWRTERSMTYRKVASENQNKILGPIRVSDSPLVDKLICGDVQIRFGIKDNQLVVESKRGYDGRTINIRKNLGSGYDAEAVLKREEAKVLDRAMQKRKESFANSVPAYQIKYSSFGQKKQAEIVIRKSQPTYPLAKVA